MPLKLEIQLNNQWNPFGNVNPGDRPGSISNNLEDGRREIYLFECAMDDSYSTIYRAKPGAEGLIDHNRLLSIDRMDLVATITRSKSYEMPIKTDRMKQRMNIRFSQE